MKKRTLLYIPLILLFVFAAAALVIQYSVLYENLTRPALPVEPSFWVFNGTLVSLRPEAEAAGFKVNDRLVAINGREIVNDGVYQEQMLKLRAGETARFTVERKPENGEAQNYELSITPKAPVRDFNFYAGQIVALIFMYFMPTF